MSPTAQLRFLIQFVGIQEVHTLQQKWVQHHIPAGHTEAPYEWRDVEIVKESE